MTGFSSFIRRRRLFEQLDDRIEKAMKDELKTISRENERKVEKMKRDIMRWAKGGDQFEIVERRFLADNLSIGNCIAVGDEGDVMSYDQFVDDFLYELFTCIEEACIYFPRDLVGAKGYSIEDELGLPMEEITSEREAREFVRRGIIDFDYRIKGNRLTVEFYTHYFIEDHEPEREWIVIERL
jgi:hypothetical protein